MLDVTAQPVIQPTATRDVANHHPCYSMPRWACVYTHPQAERWADTNLRRQGYATYLPLHRVRIRDNAIRSLWHTVERPLFGRYLFIRFDHLHESWSPIRATPGVVDLVRQGREVSYARAGSLEAVQAALAEAATQPPDSPQWAPGTPVELVAGAFYGLPAVVLKTGQDMALVAIMMLGHLREISVSLDCLRARDDV